VPALRAKLLLATAVFAHAQGDTRRAITLYEEALALLQALEDTTGVAAALGGLAEAVGSQGDFRRSAALAEAGLDLARAREPPRHGPRP